VSDVGLDEEGNPFDEANPTNEPEKCCACGLDPRTPENAGRQLYLCASCDWPFCSSCTVDAPNNDVLCLRCAP